jgi:hypothetical protein
MLDKVHWRCMCAWQGRQRRAGGLQDRHNIIRSSMSQHASQGEFVVCAWQGHAACIQCLDKGCRKRQATGKQWVHLRVPASRHSCMQANTPCTNHLQDSVQAVKSTCLPPGCRLLSLGHTAACKPTRHAQRLAGQCANCTKHMRTSWTSSAVTWWDLGAAAVASAAAESSVASGMLVSVGAAVEDGAGASTIFAGGWLAGASSMA